MLPAKISVFVLLVCSTAFGSDYHSIIDPAFRHVNTDVENCICFDDPGPHINIPDLINSQHRGMERLVIYLYRDTLAKRIEMYIPCIEKQGHIPDLVFENGDTLKPVSFENINTIFNVSPDKVLIQPNLIRPALIEKVKPIAITIPQQQAIPLKISEFDSNIWAEYQKQKNYGQNVNSYIPSYLIPERINQVNIPYEIEPVHEVHEWPSYWPSQQVETFNENKNSGHESVDESDLKNSIVKILHKNGIYVTDKGILTKEGTISDLDNLVLRPILVGNTMKLDNILQNNMGNLPTRTPYTEAILVAQTDPSKLLGTLELGKRHLPLSILTSLINVFKDAHENHNLKDITNLNDLDKITNPYQFDSINNIFIPDALYSQSRTRKFENDERNDTINQSDGNDVIIPEEQQTKKNKKYPQPVTSNSENYVNNNGNSNSLHRSLVDNVFKKWPFKFSDILETDPIIETTEKDVTVEENDDFIHGTTEQIPSAETKDITPSVKGNRDADSAMALIKSLDLVHNLQYGRTDDKQSGGEFSLKKILSDLSKHVQNVPLIGDVINLINGKDQLSDASRNLKSPMIVGDEHINYLQHQTLPQPHQSPTIKNAGGYKGPDTHGLYLIGVPPVTKVKPTTLVKGKQPGGGHFPNIKLDSSSIDHLPYIKSKNSPISLSYPRLSNIEWDFASRDGSHPQTISPDIFSIEDQVNDVEDEKDDDGDFRIIGGNAATGSGTPLSNKGRSGYMF